MARSTFETRFPQRDVLASRLLAFNVKRLRKDRGLTQDQFAGELEVEQSAVSLIENGRSNPSLLLIDAMARVLRCHVRDLFADEAGPDVARPEKESGARRRS